MLDSDEIATLGPVLSAEASEPNDEYPLSPLDSSLSFRPYGADVFRNISTSKLFLALTSILPATRRRAMLTVLNTIDARDSPAYTRPGLTPFVLPTLLPLLSSPTPKSSVFKFSLRVIGDPRMTLSYVRANETAQLVKLLEHPNIHIATIAELPLKRLLKGSKELRMRLADAILPSIKSAPVSSTWAMRVLLEALPLILVDFLQDGRFGYVWPIVFHEHQDFRQIGMAALLRRRPTMAKSASMRIGMIRAGFLSECETFCRRSPIPEDFKNMLRTYLPSLAVSIWVSGSVQQLFPLLRHDDTQVSEAAAKVIDTMSRGCSEGKIHLTKAGILRQLDMQMAGVKTRAHIANLAASLLSRLSIQIARDGGSFLLISFLMHPPAVKNAATTAMQIIMRSSEPDKFALEGSLLQHLELQPVPRQVVDFATGWLPRIIDKLVATDNHSRLIKLLTHSEARIRQLTGPKVLIAIKGARTIRDELAKSRDFLMSLSLLSESPNGDSIEFVSGVLTTMMLDFVRTGVASKVFPMLRHPKEVVRAAALSGVASVSLHHIGIKRTLIEEKLDHWLIDIIQSPHLSDPMLNALEKIIKNMVEAFAESERCCLMLLDLLLHPLTRIHDVSKVAMRAIFEKDFDIRKLLRLNLLSKIDGGPLAIINLASADFTRCLYEDVVKDESFPDIFRLLLHVDARIRIAMIFAVTPSLRTNKFFSTSLTKADFVGVVLSAFEEKRLEADVLTWFSSTASIYLASSMVLSARTAQLVQLIDHEEPKLRSAGLTMLSALANSSGEKEVASLLEDELFKEILLLLMDSDKQVLARGGTILSCLATAVSSPDNMEKIVDLLAHDDAQVRTACCKALNTALERPFSERRLLRNTLIAKRLRWSSPFTLEFFNSCSDTIFADMTVGRDFASFIALMGHEDKELRERTITALTNTMDGSSSFCQDMAEADFLAPLHSLLEAGKPTPEVERFTSMHALPSLTALTTRVNHYSSLLKFLSYENDEIRTAAWSGTARIAMGDKHRRERLLDANIMSRLKSLLDEEPDETVIFHSCAILPTVGSQCTGRGDDRLKPLLDEEPDTAMVPHVSTSGSQYPGSGNDLEILFQLLSHPHERISIACRVAFSKIMKSSIADQECLVHAVIQRFPPDTLPAAEVLCEVMSSLGETILTVGRASFFFSVLRSQEFEIDDAAEQALLALSQTATAVGKQALLRAGFVTTIADLQPEDSIRPRVVLLASKIIPWICDCALLGEACTSLVWLFGSQDDQIIGTVDASIRNLVRSLPLQIASSDIIRELSRFLNTQFSSVVVDLIRFLCFELSDLMVAKITDFVLSHHLPVLKVTGAQCILRIASGSEEHKERLMLSERFVEQLGAALEDCNDAADLCKTVELLAYNSVGRTSILLNNISNALNGHVMRTAITNKDSQISALYAFSAMIASLRSAHGPLDIDGWRRLHTSGFCMSLAKIINGMTSDLVGCLALQVAETLASFHGVTVELGFDHDLRHSVVLCLRMDDAVVLTSALRTCKHLIQDGDTMVNAMHRDGLFQYLANLIQSQVPEITILACSVAEGLAESKLTRKSLVDAGVRKALKNASSNAKKNKLTSETKHAIQKATAAALKHLGSWF